MIATSPQKVFVVLSSLVLSACDPAFESTSSQCSSASFDSSIIALEGDPDDDIEDQFVVSAQTSSNTYKLYLEDVLEAIQPADGEVLTEAELEAIDTFIRFINENGFNLNYVIDSVDVAASDMGEAFRTGGEVISSANALEFIESVITSTDGDVQNGLFQEALGLIDDAIGRGDNDEDNCSIRSLRTSLTLNGEAISDLSTVVDLSYSPFNQVDSGPRVDQVVAIDQSVEDPEDDAERLSVPFIGATFIEPDNFRREGFSQPDLRQMRVNSANGTLSLLVDEDFTGRLNFVEVATFNSFCEDDDGEITDCPGGTDTRVPAKAQCADPDGTDQTGQNEERFVNLNTRFEDVPGSTLGTEYKRLRLETDFATNEVRIYGSTYVTAIEDSDGVTIIEDPTNCETRSVLDELIELTPDEVIVISNVPDPNYDVFENDDGSENVPTPIYTFTGTDISGR